jgi:BirA family biotin operon repressor/biotin-[acetyl-CoA-carboxylase] ligase
MKRIDFDTIDSTNEEAKRRIRGFRVGSAVDDDIFDTVITAHAQTAGRGRRGRNFHSPGTGDSVYMSFILRPPAQHEALQFLTIAAAVAVCRTIEEAAPGMTELRPAIKWVNDILLEGRKVCGILAEGIPYAGAERSGLAAVILGIGVNITVQTEDFPPALRETAGSLYLPSGEREGFVQLLCKNVFEHVAQGMTGAAIISAYRHYEDTTGREVLVTRYAAPGTTVAYARAIADDGGLVVVFADGKEETLHSGEVSILPRG